MTMPNFLIIGAERAGTTSLYHSLRQHPEIFMSPVKEPRFFAYEDEMPHYNGPGDRKKVAKLRFTTLSAYQSLFAGVTDEIAIGEASVLYLYSCRAPERIRHHIPDAKLIAILRNPVDRAYSRFWANLVVQRDEPLADFAQAMQAETARIRDNWHPRWHYKQRGLYGVQLERYLKIFDRDQIHVCLSEDLDASPHDVLRDIFCFLGCDETFEPQVPTRYHAAQSHARDGALYGLLERTNLVRIILYPLPSLRLRRWLFTKVQAHTTVPRPPIPPQVRAALIEEYREDICKLADLIQRDLSGWLK